jgi:hypothetical protein
LSALEDEDGVAPSRMFTVERMEQTREVRTRDGVNFSSMHAGSAACHNLTSVIATSGRFLRQT